MVSRAKAIAASRLKVDLIILQSTHWHNNSFSFPPVYNDSMCKMHKKDLQYTLPYLKQTSLSILFVYLIKNLQAETLKQCLHLHPLHVTADTT